METDPIIRTYGTMHPCVIIDYSPGNVVAQVGFCLFAYCLMGSAMLSLLRVAQLKNANLLIISAIGFSLLFVSVPFVVLSVTFTPRLVSVLLHSVPYMWDVTGLGAFMASELVVVYATAGSFSSKYIKFYIYQAILILMVFYGVLFMARTLATTDVIDVNLPTTDSRNNLEPMAVQFEIAPLVVAFVFYPLHLLRPSLCPLHEQPVAGDVSVSSVVDEAQDCESPISATTVGISTTDSVVASTESERRISATTVGSDDWRFVLKSSTLATVSVVMLMLSVFLAMFSNRTSKSDREWTSFHNDFKTLPGAAIIAVTWSYAVPVLFLHVLVVMAYALASGTSTKIVQIAGVLFSTSSLLAHAATIPNVSDWFIGPELFQVALIIWILAQVYLTLQKWPSSRRFACVSQLVSAALATLCLVASLVTKARWADYGWMLAWLIFTFADPLDMQLIVTRFGLATLRSSPSGVYTNLCQFAWHEATTSTSSSLDIIGI